MARIRTVKPELFKHEELFELEKQTGLPIRFAFIGLFCICDREGRFKWRPRAIKTEIMPYDIHEFSEVMDSLEKSGFVDRYAVDGEEFGCIPTFLKHQSINQREAQSILPAPPDGIEKRRHVQACANTNYEYRGVNLAPALCATIIARDGGVCLRCGTTHDLTVDHIFPRSIGGTHAPSNLRTLCRSCNSARPVAGKALLDDLAKDGLTLDDMQRMCKHVQTHGEGKGKERKGREEERKEIAQAPKFDFAKELEIMGVEENAITTWLAVRKKKKSVNSEIALNGFKREVAKAGLSIADAVTLCIEKSWSGLEADWIKPKQQAAPIPQKGLEYLGKHGQATATAAQQWLEESNAR